MKKKMMYALSFTNNIYNMKYKKRYKPNLTKSTMREDWIQHIESHPEEYPATFKALGNKLIQVPKIQKAKSSLDKIIKKIKEIRNK